MLSQQRILTGLTVLALVALVAQPAAAQDDRFAIRFGLVGFFPSADTNSSTTVDIDTAVGGEFDFEWYFLKRFGLEGSIATGIDADADVDDSGSSEVFTADGVSLTPLTVGVNWHAIRSESVDLYFGVVGGQMYYSNFDITNVDDMTTSNIETEDTSTVGAQAAVDLTLSGSWALNIGIKYLAADFDVDVDGGRQNFDIDPWLFRVMGTFRF